VSVTGTYTGGGRGVLSILRSLRRGNPQLTRAGAGPAPARVMTRSTAALLSAPRSTTPQSGVVVPRAAAPLRVSHVTQSGHPGMHKGRHHRQARRHKGSEHKAAGTEPASTRAAGTRSVSIRAANGRPPGSTASARPASVTPASTAPAKPTPGSTRGTSTGPASTGAATTGPATTGGASAGLIRALPASASPGTASTAARLPPWPRCGRGAGRSRPWGSTSAAWRLAVPRRT
jgi:hypothetical protein